MDDTQAHWQRIYSTRAAEELSWHTRHIETSLQWIAELGLDPEDAIIDVGGGASTLVDDLLTLGYRAATVLDVAGAALAAARERLGAQAAAVEWLQADVLTASLPERRFALWHDRAVFHFFTEARQRRAYREQLLKALRPGGHVIVATFDRDAPATCSGLTVQRYSAGQLAAELGQAFTLQRQRHTLHVTPGGARQSFVYCQLQRVE